MTPKRPLARALRLWPALVVFVCAAEAQNFGGVRIGDPATAVAGFTGPVALDSLGADRFAKFRMPDGHDLSLTTRNFGPIIYMENNRNRAVAAVPGAGLRFGTTTRGDLRAMLGSDGFSYTSRTQRSVAGGTVYFSSFELANQPGVIATFAFFLSPERYGLGVDAALLDGIIVAQSWYLDEIWGEARTVWPGYAPVTLQY